jgi:hypothetical protein
MGRLVLFFTLGSSLLAQKADSVWVPRPKTALALSLMLPGAGQIYNRAYWKAPIVWAALGTTSYMTFREHQTYLYYRGAYQESLRDPTSYVLPPENLRRLREYHRQNRDIFLFASLILYGLTAGEAYTDAHLYGFRIEASLGLVGVLLALSW